MPPVIAGVLLLSFIQESHLATAKFAGLVAATAAAAAGFVLGRMLLPLPPPARSVSLQNA